MVDDEVPIEVDLAQTVLQNDNKQSIALSSNRMTSVLRRKPSVRQVYTNRPPTPAVIYQHKLVHTIGQRGLDFMAEPLQRLQKDLKVTGQCACRNMTVSFSSPASAYSSSSGC